MDEDSTDRGEKAEIATADWSMAVTAALTADVREERSHGAVRGGASMLLAVPRRQQLWGLTQATLPTRESGESSHLTAPTLSHERGVRCTVYGVLPSSCLLLSV